MPMHTAFAKPECRRWIHDHADKSGYRTPHKPKRGYQLAAVLVALIWVLM